MRTKTGHFLMALGSILILASLALLVYNREEEKRAGKSAAAALTQVQAAVTQSREEPEKKDPKKDKATAVPDRKRQEEPLSAVEIDGYDYIGYLSVPDVGIKLPVMDSWDYTRLNIAPCRQYGETVDKMIIAGHNYETHFGPLRSLTGGEAVYFTDMSGHTTGYVADTVGIVGPNGLDSLGEEGWNLVLYTCTYDGRQRIMVCCKKN